MASKKDQRAAPEEHRTTAEYYKLHTDAVDDLVYADESNSPPVPEEELRKYRSGLSGVPPDWVKAILVKIWFAGSVCFFLFWGLSAYVTARLDLLFVFGVGLGIVTDLLTNNSLRFLAKTARGNDRWMMFPQKRYVNFFLNILYAMLLLLCVDVWYSLLNLALLAMGRPASLGVEPILFGVFYTGFDLLFLSMKRLTARIVSDARRGAERKTRNGSHY